MAVTRRFRGHLRTILKDCKRKYGNTVYLRFRVAMRRRTDVTKRDLFPDTFVLDLRNEARRRESAERILKRCELPEVRAIEADEQVRLDFRRPVKRTLDQTEMMSR